MQAKVTKTLLVALLDPEKPLATHYGALEALAGLGKGVVGAVLVPNVGQVLRHLVPAYEGGGGAGKAAAADGAAAGGGDVEMRDAGAPSEAELKRAARRQREAGRCLEVLVTARCLFIAFL